MNIILLLAPFSVALGLMAVGAFFWTLRSGQYEDIAGAAARILIDDENPDVPSRDDGSVPENPPSATLGTGPQGTVRISVSGRAKWEKGEPHMSRRKEPPPAE